MHHTLKAAFLFEDSARWSMQSLRVGAANALLKAGASMEMIQALCGPNGGLGRNAALDSVFASMFKQSLEEISK